MSSGDAKRPPLPILLGEAPSRQGDRFHAFPLSGRPAKVLCQLAGIQPQTGGTQYGRWTWALYEHFDCSNVFERYADATPWSAPKARDRAREMLAELEHAHPFDGRAGLPPVIVCLGRKVQRAVGDALDFRAMRLRPSDPGAWGGGLFGSYGVWAAPWHVRTPVARIGEPPEREWAPWIVTIPHPSGLNRLLNDPEQRANVTRTLEQAEALARDPLLDPSTVPA